MALTVTDLARLVFTDTRVFSYYDEIPGSAAEVFLQTLNGFIDYMGTQSLTMWAYGRQVFDLIGGKGGPDNRYTIGPGGDWDTPRPTSIYRAGVILNYNTPVLEKSISILTLAQLASIRIKDLPSTFPTCLYNDLANPLSNIEVYPVPNQDGFKVALYIPQAVTQFTGDFADAMATELQYPPGYQEMLEYGMVPRIAAKFGVPITQDMISAANTSMNAVKSANGQVLDLRLRVDPAMRGSRKGSYNIYTDGYGSKG